MKRPPAALDPQKMKARESNGNVNHAGLEHNNKVLRFISLPVQPLMTEKDGIYTHKN